MKTEEFVLSEKEIKQLKSKFPTTYYFLYKREDVKEFIRLEDEAEQELIKEYEKGEIKDIDEFVIKLNKKRHKLAGDKLKAYLK